MRCRRAAEPLAVAYPIADERMPHGQSVEYEIRQQHAHREDEYRRVGRQHTLGRVLEVVEVHCRSDETIEHRHQRTGRNGQHQPLAVAAARLSAAVHTGRGQTVAHYRRDDQRDASEQHHRIALGSAEPVDEDAEHKRKTHAQRKCHGHAGQRHRGREQDVRGVEYSASGHDTAYIAPIGLRQIPDERTSLVARAAHSEAQQSGEEHHAHDIVPIEQLVTPRLAGQLLGIAPRAPAQHRDKTEYHGKHITVNDKHKLGFIRLK